MIFLRKLITLFIIIFGLQTDCMDTISSRKRPLESYAQAPDYTDESKYVKQNTDFSAHYPDLNNSCQFFLGCSLNDRMADEDDNTDHFKAHNFAVAMNQISDEIEDRQLYYLSDMIEANVNFTVLRHVDRFQHLCTSPATSLVIARPELPLLQSIEQNNDILVRLLIIHGPHFNTIDWNQRFPELAQGCEKLLNNDANSRIQKAIGNLDEETLNNSDACNSAVFKQLRNAVLAIEKAIIQALQRQIPTIHTSINHMRLNSCPINPTVMPALSYLMQNKNVSFVEEAHRKDIDIIMSIFEHAIVSNETKIVELLIQTKIDLNFSLRSFHNPLSLAVNANRDEVVKLLLDAGASTNVFNIHGQALLHTATKNENLAIVELLLKAADTNPDIKNLKNETPLHLAVNCNNPAIVQLLIDGNSNMAAKNDNGNTALHSAVYCGHMEIIELLLKAGVDTTILNNEDKTAIDCARNLSENPEYHNTTRTRFQKILNVLTEHQTNINKQLSSPSHK